MMQRVRGGDGGAGDGDGAGDPPFFRWTATTTLRNPQEPEPRCRRRYFSRTKNRADSHFPIEEPPPPFRVSRGGGGGGGVLRTTTTAWFAPPGLGASRLPSADLLSSPLSHVTMPAR